MLRGHWLLALRIATLVALAASMALLIDYTTPAEAFCSADSACAKVRGSGYGYLFGGKLPMPAVGLAGFSVLYLLTLWQESALARRLMLYGAAGAAVVGVLLLGLQAGVIRQFCWLCVTTDLAAIFAGSFAVMHSKAEPARADKGAEQQTEHASELAFQPWAVTVAGLLAVAAPALWPRMKPQPPVPPAISALQQPGKINVIEFFDFQCPHCRALHPRLMELKAQYGERVHFVRMNYPLDSHPEALPTAIGHVCARAQGKGEEFADKLLRAQHLGAIPSRLTARAFNLDLEKYDACVEAPETLKEVEKERQVLRDAGMAGLPTTYIGSRRLLGNQPDDVWVDAFRRAEQELTTGEAETGVPAWLYASACLLLFLGVGIAGRRRSTPQPTEAT